MEDIFAEILEGIKKILEWITVLIKAKRVLSSIKRKPNQEKRKTETILDLNFKDGRFQYTRKDEYEGARQSQNNRERYVKNEADRTRQTNKGDVKRQSWMRQEMRINRGLNYFDNGKHERAIEYFSQL